MDLETTVRLLIKSYGWKSLDDVLVVKSINEGVVLDIRGQRLLVERAFYNEIIKQLKDQ
jgi:hypothetical protein